MTHKLADIVSGAAATIAWRRSGARMGLMKAGFLFALAAFFGLAHAREPRYTVMRVDTRSEDLRLFLRDEQGAPLHRLRRLDTWLKSQGKRLRFAMNAGMYEPDYAPVGLYVADGRQLAPLNLAEGEGNFYLKPNGVFLLGADGPQVVESSRYPALASGVRLATQSGPLLLQQGAIHPRFDPGSKSRQIRNGVGVDGEIAYFVISDDPVTFYEFAQYFRDTLKCSDALYLDGAISGLYAPALHRYDSGPKLGPMVGVVE